MRYYLSILIFLLFLSCAEEKSVPKKISHFIPENTALLLKMNDPDLFFNNLKNNVLLRKNKDNPLTEHLKSQLSFLEYFPHKDNAFLCFLPTDKNKVAFLFISSGIPKIAPLDSIQNKKVITQNFDGLKITAYTLGEQTTFTSSKNGVFLVSDSRELLLKSLKKDSQFLSRSVDFKKALHAASDEQPAIFVNHKNGSVIFEKLFPGWDFKLNNFSNWSALDIEIAQRAIKLNGITTASDTLPKLINVFEGVHPAENKLAAVVPGNSTGFYSVTFENFSVLQKNLVQYRGKKAEEKASGAQQLLENAMEAGMVYLDENTVFALRSMDAELSKKTFATGKEIVENFRGTNIYKNPDSRKFHRLLHPLIKPGALDYFLFLNNFILFSENVQALKEVVQHVLNKTTLGTDDAFLSSMEKLSTEASILLVSNNKEFKNVLSKKVPEKFKEAGASLFFEDFPIAALQFIYSDDFAHVHALLEKTKGTANEAGISQEAMVSLDADLAAPPIFFENHRTNGLDIVVQDSDNTLYLISNKGKIYWKKDLDFRILGKINQVDLYRNGRIQLAFATPHKLHVIDRDGNIVNPFPLEFEDRITKPLAVFDYDNNRKYRFLVVQEAQVYMYNSKGQRVKGFTFSEAENEITKLPKHIRLGTKDYILIAEKSGKLNILSRTGKIRVPVETNFAFSENEWYEYENQFISTNAEGELIKIDQKGNISKGASKDSEDRKIAATAHTLVSLSENKLSIKGETLTLDYGLYTAPQIFYINDKIYVSTTDTQSHRVFLFDSNAQIIPGFPVYGNSKIDLGNADSDANLELVVQGETRAFIVYEIGEE